MDKHDLSIAAPLDENIHDQTIFKEQADKIIKDYNKYRPKLELFGQFIIGHFREVENVHTLNFRTKESNSLYKKLFRKYKTGKEEYKHLDHTNYKSVITDLLGIRVIHIFKDSWKEIDTYIRETFELHEQPKAYYRKGDSEEILAEFKNSGFDIEEHKYGYRSLHYLIKSAPDKKNKIIAEIQVRTILEEAWGEIDHYVRYPDISKNEVLQNYSMIINRLTGTADEMGLNIKQMKSEQDHFMKEIENNKELQSELKKINNKVKKELGNYKTLTAGAAVISLLGILNKGD